MPEGRDEGAPGLLVFPCAFPIKVMGSAEPGFEALVVEIVRRHAPDLGESAVTRRGSRAGRYLAVTVTVQAQSQAQLDAIYRELSVHPRVLMAL
jgi:putative lipoic acid-binding regulatory protein